MSKRQVIVLWIVALVLTAALFAVRSGSDDGFTSNTDRSRGQTLLAEFPVTEVADIKVSDGTDSAHLKKSDGRWIVADRDSYPANITKINELLRTVSEVEVVQGIEADASFGPRFGMDSESGDPSERGTVLTLGNDAGTALATLTLGKSLGNEGGAPGRFVRNQADNSGVYQVSETFSSLGTGADDWLDETFIKVEKIESISVSEIGKPDTTAWTLTRKDANAEFSLEGAKPDESLNTTATSPLKNLLSFARFDDVVPAAQTEGAWQADKKQKAIIKTFDGFEYTILFAPKKADAEKVVLGTPPAETYLMNVSVSADIPKERETAEGESEEDAKAKQAAFDERKKTLEEKFTTEKAFAERTFEVSKFTVDALLKDRAGLLQSAAPAPQAGPPGGFPPGFPGGQPGAAPRRPIQAVTPPIAIPPAPPKEQE